MKTLLSFPACLLGLLLFVAPGVSAEPRVVLNKGDHVAYIGNNLADRMQHEAWLETYLHAMHPKHELTFRNLGYSGDELTIREREDNFGNPDQWLTKAEADVVFCFFGYNESLKGEAGLDKFRKDLESNIDHMLSQKYNGQSPPRLVFFTPIAHENLNSRHLPDGTENNRQLDLYAQAMASVCRSKNVPLVDLFVPSQRLYQADPQPLTMNGIHLNPHGDREIAKVIVQDLLPGSKLPDSDAELEKLRQVVLEKNYYWFSRYRVVDGYNVFGGRSKLAWFGQSNADVMMREMEIFDVMTANRDRRVWAAAQQQDLVVKDDNLPPQLEVKTNIPGKLEGGKHLYVSGQDGISQMKLATNLEAKLFASEEMFPEMINPVQLAVDPDGRLFASVWPSYPHWNPTEPRHDRIVCLPDENRDGVADKCVVFADGLNSVTGFEFWGGGMIVAALPELWFLKDTDGDDRADVKIRLLQGLCSADSHHSCNAMVLGPDGWIYYSRGVFNTSSFETPTRVFRSGSTGVYRFNPRTFEIEFHFPIGPNPHGDVIDQWGYQFANDGTSGTGSYINIGKGMGNRQWFQKRVRPVPATGILSSSHFPPEQQGNFLICNAIGFLGVLQHKVQYNGAEITAEEIEPIVVSSDPNFRPSDVEMGGDGALYIADWHNAIIGHMQHNMRDPNRDHAHGRIYRITYKGRPLAEPVKLKGQPVEKVCEAFLRSQDNAVRYRARIELSGRSEQEIIGQVGPWAAKLDIANPVHAQAMLECLWAFEEQRLPNEELLAQVFRAAEPRVRAAAIRTIGHWQGKVKNWQPLLIAAARDDAALVRAEALKAAVEFAGDPAAAEVFFEVAIRPLDSELELVMKYAQGKLDVEKVVSTALRSGQTLSNAGQRFALKNASIEDLLRMERTVPLYEEILSRKQISAGALQETIAGLAKLKNTSADDLLLVTLRERDRAQATETVRGLGQLLLQRATADLQKQRGKIEDIATTAETKEARRYAFATLMLLDGSGENSYFVASKSKELLRDWLDGVAVVPTAELKGKLYPSVRSLMFELPPNLASESLAGVLAQPGLKVEFYDRTPGNVAVETLDKLKPTAVGVASTNITLNVPQRKKDDDFALRFTGQLLVPQAGKYTFTLSSDDGSRLYLGGQLFINHDGLHGFDAKSQSIDLPAGFQSLVVTYFDNGGGDGLELKWAGPGINGTQPIPATQLFQSGGSETLHDIAIGTLPSLPGHEAEKFADLASLVNAGKHRASAIRVLKSIPGKHWPQQGLDDLIDNVVGYISELPLQARTGPAALEAMALARALAAKLPAEQSRAVEDRLQNLNVRVIALGTVVERMIYDKEIIAVQAGKPVEFRFSNSDNMPHNFVILTPGSLEEVGTLAEETGRAPDAKDRQFVPKSKNILLASRLLEPKQSQALTFEAPTAPGVYPYVCTYPGHWRRMFGALYVVDNLDEYQANPEKYLVAHPLPVKDELLKLTSRNTEWKFDALIGSVSPLPAGRSFEVGRNLFKATNCVACHKLGGQGQEIGPDLTKIEPMKHTTEHILRSLLEPSKEIAEKYQSNQFVLDSGKILTGLVVEENAEQVKVLVDPMAKAAPVVIKKSEIEERIKSPVSIMPLGLLNKLTQEEVLDLVAYVYAKGDKKDKVYTAQPHKH